ncbi:hypothetical protein NPIL_392561 [Nephila pilipes]|uniref:Uncharacterized protein n=1 Tax=Nephila pilipes TaxID=299642 RepID=A0A8X6TEF2_NEPPI|nr:hypothetical protein NPIL_392561 [Nephila pilipes]
MQSIEIIFIFVVVLQGTKVSFGSSPFIQVIPDVIDDNLIISGSLTYEPSVEIFLTTFQDAVYSSKILRELFDFPEMSAQKFARLIQPHIFSTLSKLKCSTAREMTQICINGILKYHKNVNGALVVNVYANSISKYLLLREALDEENAEYMALTLADVMRENAKRYKRMCIKDWKFKTLPSGFVNTLINLHLFQQEYVSLMAILYANEWVLAAIEDAS